jgi:pantoate--beta-alanine ligase
MGALHEGHASLIRRAHEDNATVLVTIFVNPRQFNERSDFEAYPRDEAADVRTCGAAGAAMVFIPPVEEVYPEGFQTSVRVGALTEPLEGGSRPGHFEA